MVRLQWKKQPDGSYVAREWTVKRCATTRWGLYRNGKLATPYSMPLRQAQFEATKIASQERRICEQSIEHLL